MTAPVLAPAALKVRLLGLFEVDGAVVPTSHKVRAVLALLALNGGAPVPATDIARELWGGDWPRSWRQTVQTYIMRLRQTNGIGPDGVGTTSTGYILTFADREQVDVVRFVRLVDKARREHSQGLGPLALDTLRAAFSLWRPGVLTDLECGPVLSEWRRRITDRYRSGRQLRFEIALASGRHRDVLDDLRSEWRGDLTSEPAAALLMLALYRCQLRGEALEVSRATGRALREGLGLDPGPALQRLQQQILAGDPALELNGEH